MNLEIPLPKKGLKLGALKAIRTTAARLALPLRLIKTTDY